MHLLLLTFLTVEVLILQCECAPQRQTPSPIVIIPGVMGSQLEVNDHHTTKCGTRNSYKPLWVSFERLHHTKCAKNQLLLKYNYSTRSFTNNSFIEVKVPGFGDTSSVEFLNDSPIIKCFPKVSYFHKMVKHFVNRGYKRGKTIRAAPYDWRLAADELEKRGYFHQLKALIEEMYDNSGGTKVTLVVHSMGGLVSLHFLTGFSGINQAWKDKYIHAYITLAAAWSGGAASLHTVISGTHDIPFMFRFAKKPIGSFVRPVARSLESVPWLFPRASVFGNAVLVSTPSKNYTANDYKELFSKIGYENGYKFFQRVQNLVANYPPPNVPTYCVYGNEKDTPKSFRYAKNFKQHEKLEGVLPKVINGDGDGSVNIESAQVCLKWSSMPSRYAFHEKVVEAEHVDIVKHKFVLNYIAKIVKAPRKAKVSIVKKFVKWIKSCVI